MTRPKKKDGRLSKPNGHSDISAGGRRIDSANTLINGTQDDPDQFIVPKIVSVRSLAPTAEEEEFDERETPHCQNGEIVLDMGEDEESGDMGEGEEILGLAYPLPETEEGFLLEHVDLGHFLAGGGGLDSLSLSEEPQPPLASCSTLWDGMIHLCDMPTCAKTAASKCSACKRAFYCGDHHQQLHWDEHRHDCNPFKRAFASDTSVLVASRDIHAGQEIFSERPLLLLALPSSDAFEEPFECPSLEKTSACMVEAPACLGCNYPLPIDGTHRCSTCTLPLCSHSCEDEVPHKLGECQAILEASISVDKVWVDRTCLHALYLDVEILRALRLRNEDDVQWKSFLQLRESPRVRTYRRTSQFRRFQRELLRFAPLSNAYAQGDKDIVLATHAIIATASFRPSLRSMWKVIFRTQADFVHSCLPNTVHFVENERSGDQRKLRLVTKAAVGIMKDEVISVDCLPTPYLTHANRQSLLRRTGIHCACPRCAHPSLHGDFSGDIKCRNCEEGFVRAEEPLKGSRSVWACTRCLEEAAFSSVERTELQLSLSLAGIPKTYDRIPELIHFVESAKTSLHPGHSLIIYAWCFVESLLCKRIEGLRDPNPYKHHDAQTIRDFRLLADYADAVLSHLEAIRQGLWADKGLVLFHKFYAHFILMSREFQEGRADKKLFTQHIFKCLKVLDQSLQVLIPFDSPHASKELCQNIQEVTSTLASLKDFAAQLILPTQNSSH